MNALIGEVFRGVIGDAHLHGNRPKISLSSRSVANSPRSACAIRLVHSLDLFIAETVVIMVTDVLDHRKKRAGGQFLWLLRGLV